VALSRYSTSAQYFGVAQCSILFLRFGFFTSDILSTMIGFNSLLNCNTIAFAKPAPVLPALIKIVALAPAEVQRRGAVFAADHLIAGDAWAHFTLTHASFRRRSRGPRLQMFEQFATYTYVQFYELRSTVKSGSSQTQSRIRELSGAVDQE
jgi:hypothetical protein